MAERIITPISNKLQPLELCDGTWAETDQLRELLPLLAAVRTLGTVNMLDRRGVAHILRQLGEYEAAYLLADRAMRHRYTELLHAMPTEELHHG